MVVNKASSFWKSPLPYLFGSLGFMVILIAIALIILACSYRKRFRSAEGGGGGGGDDEEKSVKPHNPTAVVMVPQILVIMAGAENPTHLAVPAVSSSSSSLPKAGDESADHHRDRPAGDEQV
ncbi:OLC1v1009884C1 [Oldenlandia corymbosa var. corymbosa]|uniref:OLC1v1009884C1 n=1 Tax=Oldenlandia corymbosa var. corymbosa TaxID=529605 RepID=A0AAV1DSC8_OLDCO|nr:OLC1v1009884C1 [Oldenlandia corymbosa var. corymbosa]